MALKGTMLLNDADSPACLTGTQYILASEAGSYENSGG
jgi:hypothetical protein